ncbi:MAG TPA: PP2C family protein-serine/threonine phosphatase [Vicinamibacterales bacterium]|nr:PP2C family protein-serine/threonine phosphatase [Vicinamibacterales bacterium]
MVQLSRADLALSFLAFAVIALGAGALLTGLLRRRAAERALILFGFFSLLYGMRVAMSLPFVQAMPSLSPHALKEIQFDITYVLPLPLMLLVEQFVGRGWRNTMHLALWLQAAYSSLGIATDVVTGIPGAVIVVKPYIILLMGTVALGNILYGVRRAGNIPPVLTIGFGAFLATVGVYNFDQIISRQISPRIETVGFVVLVACLAYAVTGRALDTEARLLAIEREIETAQRIQASILPQEAPDIPGLSVCARYRPMATMAGDFYDFLPIDGRCLGVLVADVSGHGVPASLIASMVKVALSAEAPWAGDPGRVLNGMNSVLVGLLGRQRDYVTACYLVVDPAAGEVRYGGAGHPRPLVRSADGHVESLDEGGTILGQFADAQYVGTTRRVGPGTRILVYTDGVTEAASPDGEFFGGHRLEALLADRGHIDGERFADELLATLARWRGGAKLDDDVTIVVVDLLRSGARRSGSAGAGPASVDGRANRHSV